MSTAPVSPSLLRLPQVKARTGKARSTIYAEIAKGTFPAPVKVGERSVAWSSQAIDEWINERLAAGASAELAK